MSLQHRLMKCLLLGAITKRTCEKTGKRRNVPCPYGSFFFCVVCIGFLIVFLLIFYGESVFYTKTTFFFRKTVV